MGMLFTKVVFPTLTLSRQVLLSLVHLTLSLVPMALLHGVSAVASPTTSKLTSATNATCSCSLMATLLSHLQVTMAFAVVPIYTAVVHNNMVVHNNSVVMQYPRAVASLNNSVVVRNNVVVPNNSVVVLNNTMVVLNSSVVVHIPKVVKVEAKASKSNGA